MPTDPQKMKAFLASRGAVVATPAVPLDVASLPSPGEVLYTPPNPDGSRKACSNCVLYAVAQRQCYIHAQTEVINPSAICGYHVWTPQPQQSFPRRLPILPVSPELSGLEDVPGGTSCDICVAYQPLSMDLGECSKVRAAEIMPGTLATVDAKGCCARWSPK